MIYLFKNSIGQIGLSLFATCILSSQLCLAQTQIHFSSDVKIENLGDQKTSTKASGESHILNKDEVALISSPDKMPILVFPAASTSRIDLQLPELPLYIQKKVEKEADLALAQVFAESMQIQALIQERKLDEAKQRLDSLQGKFPDIKFLEFTRASLLFLMGDSQTALQVAEDALQLFPSYQQGQEFVKSLRGT